MFFTGVLFISSFHMVESGMEGLHHVVIYFGKSDTNALVLPWITMNK